MDSVDLLCRVEGIGPDRAETLLDAFGTGSEVAARAVSNWGAIAALDGFSEHSAKTLYREMRRAGVYDMLRFRDDRS